MSAVEVESSHQLPLVTIQVSFLAGAAHDPGGAAGLSRVVARMLRRGCHGLGSTQLEQQIELLGGELSAGAGLGTSTVRCEVLRRSLEPMAALLSRILAEPSFDEVELGRLRRQAVAELVAARDEDGRLAARALRRHLFAGHPQGRAPAGRAADLPTITREQAVEFHQRHYCRGNAVIGVAGDVSPAQGEAVAAQLLAALPEGSRTTYPKVEPAAFRGRHLVIVDKPQRSQCQLVVGTLGTRADDDDHHALLVANTVFGGTFTSRLTREVRVERGWSYGASSHLTLGRAREAFSMWTAPAATDASACLALEIGLLERWREGGIDAAELERCQQYLRRSHAFEIDTASKRLQQKLDRHLLGLEADYHARFVDRVTAVTLDEANAAVRRRIAPSQLWIAAVATETESGAALRDAVEGLCDARVEPFDLE